MPVSAESCICVLCLQTAGVPQDLIKRVVERVPQAWREQAAVIAPRLLPAQTRLPAYFEVLANSST